MIDRQSLSVWLLYQEQFFFFFFYCSHAKSKKWTMFPLVSSKAFVPAIIQRCGDLSQLPQQAWESFVAVWHTHPVSLLTAETWWTRCILLQSFLSSPPSLYSSSSSFNSCIPWLWKTCPSSGTQTGAPSRKQISQGKFFHLIISMHLGKSIQSFYRALHVS